MLLVAYYHLAAGRKSASRPDTFFFKNHHCEEALIALTGACPCRGWRGRGQQWKEVTYPTLTCQVIARPEQESKWTLSMPHKMEERRKLCSPWQPMKGWAMGPSMGVYWLDITRASHRTWHVVETSSFYWLFWIWEVCPYHRHSGLADHRWWTLSSRVIAPEARAHQILWIRGKPDSTLKRGKSKWV